MRSVIILGSGRSGTSMVAGTLAKAGYFMGEDLYCPRQSNPKGFFEAPEINGINEELIARAIPKRPPVVGRWFFRARPVYGQRWLARVPLETKIKSSLATVERIRRVVERQPYCFKDPRFCYTLPAWRPYLKDTVFVCVFRHPAVAAESILRECADAQYLHGLSIDFEGALMVWTLMYRHVLEIHSHEGEWLFLHFDQVLQDEGLDRLEEFTGAGIDRGFPEASLRRTVSGLAVPKASLSIYERLCELASFSEKRA
jgi:hypothetical protein